MLYSLFFNDGRFRCRYGRKGRGPDEYIRITSLCIDKWKKEVCLLDQYGSKLLFYDYAGHFLRSEPLFYRYSFIASIDNCYVLGTSSSSNTSLSGISYHRLLISSHNQEPLFKGFPYPKNMYNEFSMVNKTLQTFGDKVYFYTLLSDTIWSVSTGECKAEYVIKYPGMNSLFSTLEIESMTNEKYDLKTNDISHFNGFFSSTKSFTYFSLVDNNRRIIPLVYCHSTGNILYGQFFSTKLPNNSLLSSVLRKLEFVVDDSTFMTVLRPHSLIKIASSKEEIMGIKFEGKDLQLLKNLSEEDNPVLMLVKLKDF